MTDFADRAVFAAALLAGGVVVADVAGMTAERWVEAEMAREPHTICARDSRGVMRCLDFGGHA